MRKIFLYTVLIVLAGVGCRKKDNPRIPDFTRVPMPTITKAAGSDLTISATTPNNFTGKFNVDLFFKNDIKPAKFDIVVIKNGNKSNVKVLQADVASFPAALTVTGAQLATLFGAPIVVGDKFDIGADVYTQNGDKYVAFPAVGVGYGTGVATQGGASVSINYTAVCPFNINDFVGAGSIDDQDFWGATYNVDVSLQGTDTYKVTNWVEEPGYFILIKVNSAALTVTVSKQTYSTVLPGTSYTNPTVEGTGTIDACTKQITMNLTNTVSQGSFGVAKTILKKL